MSAALTPPFMVAALVLCVAGVAKLRSPSGAAAALGTRPWAIRALAVCEVVLGAACVVHPTRALAAALAVLYAGFATVAAILRRRRVGCGCFGDDDLPVSQAHVVASELLGALALTAALARPFGLSWLASQPAPMSLVAGAGVLAATYATVLIYTQLPVAWNAWSAE